MLLCPGENEVKICDRNSSADTKVGVWHQTTTIYQIQIERIPVLISDL